MPAMSWAERLFCQSSLWSPISKRHLEWAIGTEQLQGNVLEIGSGNGTVAKELMSKFPDVSFTATDIDPLMLQEARKNLPDATTIRHADVTKLPFADNSFDFVVSFIMMHHVIEWEEALREVYRVLRPGGRFIGYDLVKTHATVLLHVLDRSPNKLILPEELESTCELLGFESVKVELGSLGQAMRFIAAAK